MAYDANAVIQAQVDKAADFNGAAYTIGATPRRAEYVRVIYLNTSTASGSATADFLVDVSYDAGSTYNSGLFRSPTISIPSGSANAVSGEIHIPIEVSPTDPSKPVVIRLTLDYTATSSPSGPNVTYRGDLVLGRPG